MSRWTHVLGVIRYDSFSRNVWPEPHNKEEICALEMEIVADSYQRARVPHGSEGPIEMQFKQSQRGPLVIVTGDLRDFDEDDLKYILRWVIEGHEITMRRIEERGMAFFMLRDIAIDCNVEGCDDIFVIREADRGGELLPTLFRCSATAVGMEDTDDER